VLRVLQGHVSPDRYQQYLRTAAHGIASSSSSSGTSQADAAPYIAQGWGSLTGSSSSSRAAQQQHMQDAAFGSNRGWGRVRDPWAAAAAARRGSLGSSSGSSSSSWGSSRGSVLVGSFFGGGSSSSSGDQISMSGLWGGASLETHLSAAGLHPGQVGVPARVGAGPSSSMMAAAGGGDEEASEAAAEAARQLETEVVVGVAASKYFSLALTAKGEVWTFGKFEMMRMHATIICRMHCWREGVSAVSCIRSGR
jgi:hypothetical protein